MTTSNMPGDAPPDRARSQKLEVWICFLLQMHPVTPTTLVSIGWFPRQRAAGKFLRRLAGQNRIRLVGTLGRSTGRPEHVFCMWQPEPDDLLHQVRLTELFLRLDAGTIQRGPFVADQTIRPDAELWIKGQLYYLELDRAAADADTFLRRLSAYQGCPHPSLWICLGAARAEWLRQRAGQLRAPALFVSLDEAQTNPHAESWQDVAGGKAGLPYEAWERPR